MSARVYDGPSLNGMLPAIAFLQNEPSALAVHWLDPQPGERIVDMCAAPGGKATHCAAMMLAREKAAARARAAAGSGDGGEGDGFVIALDRSASRLAAVTNLAKRLGLSESLRTIRMDATQAHLRLAKAVDLSPSAGFDRVLLDPPCSALGLRPRLQITATIDDLRACAAYQCRLLDAAAALLRVGGTLLYSTCTLSAEENEGVVAYALRGCAVPLKLIPPPPHLRLGRAGWAGCGLDDCEREMVQRFDPALQPDSIGFFLAKMQRVR